MSEKEKEIVEKLNNALPNMSEFDKGYILGMVENLVSEQTEKEREKEKK